MTTIQLGLYIQQKSKKIVKVKEKLEVAKKRNDIDEVTFYSMQLKSLTERVENAKVNLQGVGVHV